MTKQRSLVPSQRELITAMSEDELSANVRGLALRKGWKVQWIPDWVWRHIFLWAQQHRRAQEWAEPGWPDLVLCRPPVVLVRELKRHNGRLRPPQQEWLDSLAASGQNVGVWRPADWYSGLIEQELT